MKFNLLDYSSMQSIDKVNIDSTPDGSAITITSKTKNIEVNNCKIVFSDNVFIIKGFVYLKDNLFEEVKYFLSN